MKAGKWKSQKKLVVYMLVVSLCLSSGFADMGSETAEAAWESAGGDWKYEVINSQEVKIAGYTGEDTKIQIPETIVDSSGASYQVTEIANSAFQDYTSLTEIEIPASVTKIGQYAFLGCSNLTSISLPSGLTELSSGTFAGCSSLSEIFLPDSITTIGDSAFQSCSNLTRIILPDGIANIPFSAFRSCKNLTDIQFPASLTTIGGWAFEGCTALTEMEIPEGVTALGDNVFYHCAALQKIKLPSTLESIGKKAFVDTCLESLEIPKNVSVIGEGLFNGLNDYGENSYIKITSLIVDEENTTYDSRQNCNAIIETATGTLLYGSNRTNKIPEGVKTIGRYAFSGCKDLEEIEISSTVSDIEGHIFVNCSNLSKITVSAENQTFDSREDCNGIIETKSNMLVVGCKTTKIPENVSDIEIAAYSGCEGLTGIELPSGIREIKDMTFLSCTGLTSVCIPDGVWSIGVYAFDQCKNLKSVYIPASVEKFGEFAGESTNVFLGCPELVIYTVEGAKAVEFAEKYGISYSFEEMPQAETPAETTQQPQTPQETGIPQGTIQPPQATEKPQETPFPQPTLKPQITETPVVPDTTQKPQEIENQKENKPDRPTIKKLKNQSVKTVTVTLSKKVSGAAGYQVAYAEKASMKGQKKKNFKGIRVTINGMKKNKMYYFRVRAYVKTKDTMVYGEWSQRKSVMVKK